MRRPVLASLAAAAVLALMLGACGKRAELRAPDDAETAYTYPKPYPKPSTVLPPAGAKEEPEARPRALPAPGGAGDITVFPNARRSTTTTYGTPAPQ